MSFSLTRLLIGRRIANREASDRGLGVLTGLPAMGLDGLGSASYGPEAALTVLAATGAAGLGTIGVITAIIVALLAIVFLSLLADHRRLSQTTAAPTSSPRTTSARRPACWQRRP